MKAEIKLCTSLFSVVTLPGFSAWSRSPSSCTEENKTYLQTLCFQWSNTQVEVKMLMMLLNMNESDSPKVNVRYPLRRNKVISPFLFSRTYEDW
jgi:hypothetical protein